MKRVMVSAAIVASLFTGGAPLAAQPGWNAPAFWRGAPAGVMQRADFLQRRIDNGIRDGSIDRREAWRVQRELRNIREDARRAAWRNGGRLRPAEEARLQARLDNLSRQIRCIRRSW